MFVSMRESLFSFNVNTLTCWRLGWQKGEVSSTLKNLPERRYEFSAPLMQINNYDLAQKRVEDISGISSLHGIFVYWISQNMFSRKKEILIKEKYHKKVHVAVQRTILRTLRIEYFLMVFNRKTEAWETSLNKQLYFNFFTIFEYELVLVFLWCI